MLQGMEEESFTQKEETVMEGGHTGRFQSLAKAQRPLIAYLTCKYNAFFLDKQAL